MRAGHVLDGSLLAADFKAGQIPAGPPGPAGPAGPPGISQKQVVTAQTATDSSTPKSITATCPAGKQAVAGGANLTGPAGPALFATQPTGNNAWFSYAYEVNATQGAWRLTSFVVCARVT